MEGWKLIQTDDILLMSWNIHLFWEIKKNVFVQGLLKRVLFLIFLFERVISIVMQQNLSENKGIYMTFWNLMLN